MTSMASSIQPRPPAMSDLRSAGEMSRGEWRGQAERKDADAGEEESPDAISSRYRPVSVWRAQCFQRCAEPEGPALTSPAKGGRPRRKTRCPRQEGCVPRRVSSGRPG